MKRWHVLRKLACLCCCFVMLGQVVADETTAPPAPTDEVVIAKEQADLESLTIEFTSEATDFKSADELGNNHGIRNLCKHLADVEGIVGFDLQNDDRLRIALKAENVNGEFKRKSDCPTNTQFTGPVALVENENTQSAVKAVLVAWTRLRHPGLEEHEGVMTIKESTTDRWIDITLKKKPDPSAVGFVPRN